MVGYAATVAPGEWITATGECVNDRMHGQQFRAGFIWTAEPTSLEGIEVHDLVYGFGELGALVPVHAVTVHKSQGSEYSAVVIPVLTQHYAMLKRNLLYTAVTRGKRLVVLVGQEKAVATSKSIRSASIS